MLKHTGPTITNAVPTPTGQQQQLRSSNTSSAPRGIHLRPQQPLNISTLNASNLQTSTTTNTTGNATTTTNITNGGQRIPTLLNIAQTVGSTATTAAGATTTAGTNTTIPNGISPNLHTYSNQHVMAGGGNTSLNHNLQHHNYSNCNNLTGGGLSLMSHLQHHKHHGPGPREALTSLGLLCLVSLLLALLSLIFLLKISPNGREDAITRGTTEDFVIVYDVTLALCALSLSLNLCCLLVCAIQFLFAVKLVRSPMFNGRDNKYLEKSSTSRTCAVGGFFISIPIFLTGIILYTFNHFHSTPAIITSVLIGIGIVFCGGAMVHNVFIWQKEKTISYRSPVMSAPHHASHHTLQPMSLVSHIGAITPPIQFLNHSHHIGGGTFNQSMNAQQLQHQQQQLQLHPTSVTPVSPNHSHGSFNPLASGAISSSFIMRPSTATPPTPKPPNGCVTTMNGREASGSVSPGIPPTLDMSNITSISLHELSTLV